MPRATIVLVCLSSACATTQSAQAPQNAEPSSGELTLARAEALVEAFAAKHPSVAKNDPLHEPKSLDDVLEILRRDQSELFGGGVSYASKHKGAKPEALHAQLELAWGEANVILAELLWENAARLRPVAQRLEVRAAASADGSQDELAQTRASITESSETAEALMRVAAEHFRLGGELARGVIENYPGDYLGYRVAADYYRLRQDWQGFAEMVKKIQGTNPDSNGLVFLSGVAALQRDFDLARANEHFRKALERDAKFARAQAQLVLSQATVKDQHAEYLKLKALNARHQVVVWAGDAIEKAYRRWQQRQQ